MYDVAVEITPSEKLNGLEATSINFRAAYINPAFTDQQVSMRVFFSCASFVALVWYATVVCCRV